MGKKSRPESRAPNEGASLAAAVAAEQAERDEFMRQFWIGMGMPPGLTYEQGQAWAVRQGAETDARDKAFQSRKAALEREIEANCRALMRAAGFSEAELTLGGYLPSSVDPTDPRWAAYKEAMKLLQQEQAALPRALGCEAEAARYAMEQLWIAEQQLPAGWKGIDVPDQLDSLAKIAHYVWLETQTLAMRGEGGRGSSWMEEARNLFDNVHAALRKLKASNLHEAPRQFPANPDDALNELGALHAWIIQQDAREQTAPPGQPPGEKGNPRKPRKRGRKGADEATRKHEQEVANAWQKARESGVYKPDFARDNGFKTARDLNTLLNRVAARKHPARNRRSD